MKRTVLYVLGIGHSGSTILDALLNHSPGVFGMSGAAALFRSARKGAKCSCGASVVDCPAWGDILARLGEGRVQALLQSNELIVRERRFLRFLVPGRMAREYARLNDGLYKATFNSTGADILVDSSKNLSRAWALLRYSRYDVRFVHLIRDPRGYVNGMNKNRRRAGEQGRRYVAPMARWLAKNLAATMLGAVAPDRYIRVSYENLLMEPHATLRRIGAFGEVDFARTLTAIDRDELLSGYHVVSGNPQVRSSEGVWGSVRLRPDFVLRNRLEGIDAKRFWYLGGFLSALWGYDLHQGYLDGFEARVESAGEGTP